MTVVDTTTGEIVEPGTDLAPVNPSSAVAVTSYLERARTWLATAVEQTGPEQIAMAKAEIATAAEATKQLGLSKEIQLDAQEMVRRAEYALGKAIRKGQAEGTIRRPGEITRSHDRWNGTDHQTTNSIKASPSDFAPKGELAGPRGEDGIYAMADGAPDPDDFDAAIEEAKAEGNLSRANVVRKVKKQTGPTTRDQRADLIADLAAQGYSSRQMPEKVGVTEETVRQIAREYDIEIPADKAIRKTRRHNSQRIASETVAALEGLAMGVRLINYDELDPGEMRRWADSLTDSMSELRRFHKQIKETTHA